MEAARGRGPGGKGQEMKRSALVQVVTAWLGLLLTTGAPAATVTVQVLATTDLHGMIRHGAAAEDAGGWLRLATVIRRERDAFGSSRTLVVDCGDSLQGSYEALTSRGGVATALLKATPVDVWVPGNHDFDFGTPRLVRFLSGFGDRALAGNLTLPDPAAPGGRRRLPAWRLFSRNGASVAVIGVTASYLNQWLTGERTSGYTVEKAVATLERILPEVHQAGPDAILLAAHQGWDPEDARGVNEIADIAQRFPEIDLILGGHTHQTVPGRRIGPRTWYVQPGSGADWVGQVRLTVDTASHRVVDITSKLLPAGPEVIPDAAANAAVRDDLDEAARFGREPAGVLATALDAGGMPGETCAMSELLCQALAEAVTADVALHGKLTPAGLPAGPVTAADLFTLIPYENDVVTVEVTAAELAEIVLEQQSQRTGSYYSGLWGLHGRIDPGGKTVRFTDAAGRPVPPDRRLRLVLNSHAAAGSGGRFPRLRGLVHSPGAGMAMTGLDTREALRRFLLAHSPYTPRAETWLTSRPAPAAPASSPPGSWHGVESRPVAP